MAGWIINRREGALIDDLLNDPRWIQPPDGLTEHRSAIAAPLMVGAEALGAMLLFHREPSNFSAEHRELVQAAANQIAIAINNAELFNLIREQAESLGGMLRTQQVEASRSMAILEAVADGVLVTDAQNIITLLGNRWMNLLASLEVRQNPGWKPFRTGRKIPVRMKVLAPMPNESLWKTRAWYPFTWHQW